jgi:hypothetical protein
MRLVCELRHPHQRSRVLPISKPSIDAWKLSKAVESYSFGAISTNVLTNRFVQS